MNYYINHFIFDSEDKYSSSLVLIKAVRIVDFILENVFDEFVRKISIC